jgi:hypothetical protein
MLHRGAVHVLLSNSVLVLLDIYSTVRHFNRRNVEVINPSLAQWSLSPTSRGLALKYSALCIYVLCMDLRTNSDYFLMRY